MPVLLNGGKQCNTAGDELDLISHSPHASFFFVSWLVG